MFYTPEVLTKQRTFHFFVHHYGTVYIQDYRITKHKRYATTIHSRYQITCHAVLCHSFEITRDLTNKNIGLQRA